MFSYTGLTPGQVHILREKYHVYMLKSGRASISGCKFFQVIHLLQELTFRIVTRKNVAYVAQAIDDAVRNAQ